MVPSSYKRCQSEVCEIWGLQWNHGKSIHISSFEFYVYFTRKNLLFLFYTSTFTKHPHQFIYFTHLFNKIFIILQFFYYSLPHCPSLSQTHSHHHHHHQKPKAIKSETDLQTRRSKLHQNPPDLHPKSKKNQHQVNQHQSTHTTKNQHRSKHHRLHASTPPRSHHVVTPQRRSRHAMNSGGML